MKVASISLCVLVLLLGGQVVAQDVPEGVVIQPGGARPARGGSPAQPNASPTGQPSTPPTEGEKKKEGSEGEKDGDSSDSIKRPDKPPRVPDPREFDVRPDEDGRIIFNFYGQPWPDVLQWLANISDTSLDWQELPKDYVNVTTTRRYTIPEAHDLFNRLLMERGYTMIRQGRILSVVRISKVDPSLLTRVEDESELLDLPSHQFVKITFGLPDELKADEAANDVKPLLSPHAKVQPLVATNRLLVIDAVANLREVSRLINAEHAAAVGHTVPKEFEVRFARADRVADQVMILLGLDPSSRRTPQELQVEQQKLQLFQQMQQRGADVSKYLRKDDSPRVFLAVNDRNNSILVNAPRNEMQIIERAILQLDVPSGSTAGAVSGALSMERYQLVTISPQSIVTALEEIGDLDPRTRIQTDSDARVVFANATPRDHEKIRAMIDNLDGTGRQLEVIWLRRLPADAVAATVYNLMVGKEEEDDESSRRSSYYYYGYRDSSRDDNKPKGTFRVDADTENNRLLLWANDSELAEVRKFLEKLGEIPGRSGNPHTVRFLEPRDVEGTRRLLEQLQRAWNGPNPLQIEAPPAAEEAEDSSPESKPPLPAEARTRGRTDYFVAASTVVDAPPVLPVTGNTVQDAGRSQPIQTKPAAANSAPPISISVTDDGRIILKSADTAALDELQDLISSLMPPAPNFKVFYLKYALASLVTLNLEEYFEEEKTTDTEENWWRAWYGMPFDSGQSKDGGSGLSQQRKIRFIYDYDTNSILVSNASPAQMSVVESLIKIYDMPPSEDSISARSFQIFELKYSRADSVAKTIKEVYRDLLSSKDKDFEQKGAQKPEGSQTNNYYRIQGTGSEGDEKPTKVKATFLGALSVGVDEITNTVIVSAQEEWMPSVSKMITFLDEQAKPDLAIAVQRIDGDIDVKALQAVLAGMIGEAWVGNKPPPKPQPTAQPQQPGAQPPGAPANQAAPAAATPVASE